MSSYDTSAVTSGFINSLWGLRNPPSAVTDSQLAALLAPYLGPLPTYVKDANGYITSAPFTTNMTLAVHDQVQKFLTDLQTPSVTNGTLQTDLTNILTSAQTKQVEVYGQPAPLPPGSGGLARNTASALGSLIASLQTAGILSGFTGTSYTVDTANATVTLGAWLNTPANQALLNTAQAQLTQDVPISTGVITVSGKDKEIRIPLNQSLQEVIQTQYVERGANLVYAGLQALVDQQQGAEDSIRALSQLQQVYNSIKAIPTSDLITDFNTTVPATFTHDVAEFLFNQAQQLGGQLDFYSDVNISFSINTVSPSSNAPGADPPVFYFASESALESAISWSVNSNILNININSSLLSYGFQIPNINNVTAGEIVVSTLSGFVTSNRSFALVKSSSPQVDITNDLLNLIINKYGPSSSQSLFTTQSTKDFLENLDAGNPTNYIADLPNVLPFIFPKPGTTFDTSVIQFNGAPLSTAVGGNMQQLINELYQNYLQQSAQRLIETANINGSVIINDPNMTIDSATGQTGWIVNPVLTGTDAQTAANNLQVIRSLLAYAYYLNVPGTTNPNATTNVTASSSALISLTTLPNGTTPIPPPVVGSQGALSGNITTGAGGEFGFAQGGSLESNLATIIGNLVGGSAFIGGSSSVTGSVTYASDGSLNLTKWILGIWPTGLGDTANIPSGIALDQTQSYLTNAFSAASSLNDALQQQLQQSFFLFQEFMQSATDTLSAINQLIVKKAQAISG